MLVSVVIPVYNVEKYLNRSIESVINQTYQDLEILLIDDGSTDSSLQLCKLASEKDNRIKVIHKNNEGAALARNTGIEYANGDYILFLDSDDYIETNMIEKLCSLAQKTDADIVTFGECIVNNQGTIIKRRIPCPDKYIYIGDEVQQKLLPDLMGVDSKTGKDSQLLMAFRTTFIRREILVSNNLTIKSEREIFSEDVYSLLKFYKYINTVAILPEAPYYYCENETSITHTFKANMYSKIKALYDSCIEICNDYGYNQAVKDKLLQPYFSFTIASLKMIVNSNLAFTQKLVKLKEVINDQHLVAILENADLSGESLQRKVLFATLRWKNCLLCYTLMKLKS